MEKAAKKKKKKVSKRKAARSLLYIRWLSIGPSISVLVSFVVLCNHIRKKMVAPTRLDSDSLSLSLMLPLFFRFVIRFLIFLLGCLVRGALRVFMSDHKITGNKSQQHGIRLSAPPCKRRINKQSFLAEDGDTQPQKEKIFDNKTQRKTQRTEKSRRRRWSFKKRRKKRRLGQAAVGLPIEKRSNLHYRAPDYTIPYYLLYLSIYCLVGSIA